MRGAQVRVKWRAKGPGRSFFRPITLTLKSKAFRPTSDNRFVHITGAHGALCCAHARLGAITILLPMRA
jgi:hypothetical protein